MSVKTYALTTRQRLIDFLGLSSSSLTTAQQNVLDRIIDAATEYIEKYTGRRFKKTAYTNEIYDGDSSGTLMLRNYPVISSESFVIGVRSSGLNEGSFSSVNAINYIVDYASGVVRAMGGSRFQSGRGMYRISYTAGYDFDNSSTFLSDTEAGDVEYAMWKLCSDAYLSRKAKTGITSERLGDYAVTFSKTSYGDEEVKAILDKYAKIDAQGGLTPMNY